MVLKKQMVIPKWHHGWNNTKSWSNCICAPGWWFGCLNFLFSHILGIIIPTDFHIFCRRWKHLRDCICAQCVPFTDIGMSSVFFDTPVESCHMFETHSWRVLPYQGLFVTQEMGLSASRVPLFQWIGMIRTSVSFWESHRLAPFSDILVVCWSILDTPKLSPWCDFLSALSGSSLGRSIQIDQPQMPLSHVKGDPRGCTMYSFPWFSTQFCLGNWSTRSIRLSAFPSFISDKVFTRRCNADTKERGSPSIGPAFLIQLRVEVQELWSEFALSGDMVQWTTVTSGALVVLRKLTDLWVLPAHVIWIVAEKIRRDLFIGTWFKKKGNVKRKKRPTQPGMNLAWSLRGLSTRTAVLLPTVLTVFTDAAFRRFVVWTVRVPGWAGPALHGQRLF